MNVYLIFSFNNYEANGGMWDCMGMGTDEQKMIAVAKEKHADYSGHVEDGYEIVYLWGQYDGYGLVNKESDWAREVPVIK